jgi:hypothetical protein
MRRKERTVEFRTPAMVEELVAGEGIDIYLTVEDAEALARAAKAADIKDRRTKALMEQTLDQIAVVCRDVRDRIEAGDKWIGAAVGPAIISSPERSPKTIDPAAPKTVN